KRFLTEWRGGRQVAAIDLGPAEGLRGAHNHQNACAAWAACRALGIGPRQIEPALTSFPGLAHRMERVGEVGGVACVNDSKATNADAAIRALASFERIRWIAGGRAKAGGIEAALAHMDGVLCTYLIGEAEEAFAAQLGERAHRRCGTLEAAVAAALGDARPGETVLFSPAAASFDQFTDFEARGEAFRALVAAAATEEVQP
ncbi:MAG: cyanophycin synthetase, partial [Pseudomonadota bacterium]